MTAIVEIFTKTTCPFCMRAKTLLQKKGITYQEYSIDNNESLRSHMIERSNGRHTVPQIFINGAGIGGCDDLINLESKGKLDQLLK